MILPLDFESCIAHIIACAVDGYMLYQYRSYILLALPKVQKSIHVLLQGNLGKGSGDVIELLEINSGKRPEVPEVHA